MYTNSKQGMREVAGIRMCIISVTQLTATPISSTKIIAEPFLHVESCADGSYRLHTIVFIPKMLAPFPKDQVTADLLPIKSTESEEAKIYLKYNGITQEATELTTILQNKILCRNFELLYDAIEGQSDYHVYKIVFNYALADSSTMSANGIVMRDRNIDPETSRGTVTIVAG